ncbi:FHA domain-containing protein [Variovorax sp. PCZ-1]|uniref:FHA domain-containing protein n=1 Tax=Variovorax sp. PCZ-1 TaxID=2835533 RepID=UPI001BD047EB|nr:FHA domain-containing protein [Variovorax sp. PCZ-1]MBS7807695.1 FHA domain-containing protein [Variovorax sp. PCZ-1]
MPQLITTVDGVEIHRTYLTRVRTTLGRRPDNHIVLTDLAVSGEHCVFELSGLSDVVVIDSGSTNGTYISGAMVKMHLLSDEDVISIGRFKIQYFSANELTDEGKTVSMTLSGGLAPAATSGAMHASLKMLTGSSAGLEIPVSKAVSTFGQPGIALIAIAHRRQGYFISCLEAQQIPKLNGKAISDEPVQLVDRDVIELAGSALEFLLKA